MEEYAATTHNQVSLPVPRAAEAAFSSEQPQTYEESLLVIAALQNRVLSLEGELEVRRGTDEELRSAAFTDSLTGVRSRRHYDEKILPELAAHISDEKREASKEIIFGFLDVNDLRKLNNTHGHIGADTILVLIAKAIEAGVGETDTVCRYGGDEFIVVRRLDATQAQDTATQIEETRASIAEQVELRCIDDQGKPTSYGVSMGFVRVRDYKTAEAAIIAADAAATKDKENKPERPGLNSALRAVPIALFDTDYEI